MTSAQGYHGAPKGLLQAHRTASACLCLWARTELSEAVGGGEASMMLK